MKRAFAALAALAALACEQQLALEEPHHEDAVQFRASGDALLEEMQREDGWLVSPALPAADDFDRVVVMFDAKTPVAVEVRTSQDAETFGPWRALDLVFSEEEAHTGAIDTDGGLLLQMRVQAPVEAGLSFVSLSAFPIADDDDATLAAGSRTAGLLRDSEDVVSVSEWGGQAPRCGLSSHTPNRITIHHTESPNNPNVSPAVRLRQIQSYHFSRGWCDVGYHLLIGHDGRIYQGRPENKLGSHAGAGNNTGNVGISFIGSFMTELPNAAMLDAGARAIRGVANEWNIAIDRQHVLGHRQMRSTDCPGDALYAFLDDLVDMAADGTSAPSTPTPPVLDDPQRIDTFPAVISGNTTGSSRDSFDSYSCSPSTNESGPEDVYEVVVSAPGFLRVEVDDGGNVDIDLHLLSSLSASACLDRDDEFIRFAVTPGTYFLVADSYYSSVYGTRDGPYTLRVDLEVTTPPATPTGPSSGSCEMLDTDLRMFWSSCAVDDCTRVNGESFLSLPTTGPVVKEAHLVTLDEDFPSGWPSASRDGISRHYQLSEAASGYVMSRTESWAPAGEGGSRYGQGAVGTRLPIEDEAWYITMYWKSRPPAGTRMIVTNPQNGRSVVASAGWETGPGSNTAVAGVSEEIHHYLGTTHRDDLTIGFAAQDNLPLGPIDCGATGATTPDPVTPDPAPVTTTTSYIDLPETHEASAAAEALREIGAMWGCGPDTFCPGNDLLRDQLANLIATVETSAYDVPGTQLFSDVSSSHWAYDAVQELGARSITVGCGGGQYCPGLYVSRATFAVYLKRAFGLSSRTPGSFSDVSSSYWAGSSIEAAFQAGLVEECAPGKYCPDEPITRADAARYAAGAYGLLP